MVIICNSLLNIFTWGRIFENFSDDLVSDLAPDPDRNYVWTIGIDHGHDIASQVAILSAIDITDQGKPLIYIVDEYVASGASAQIHAKGIIAMIRLFGPSCSDTD